MLFSKGGLGAAAAAAKFLRGRSSAAKRHGTFEMEEWDDVDVGVNMGDRLSLFNVDAGGYLTSEGYVINRRNRVVLFVVPLFPGVTCVSCTALPYAVALTCVVKGSLTTIATSTAIRCQAISMVRHGGGSWALFLFVVSSAEASLCSNLTAAIRLRFHDHAKV